MKCPHCQKEISESGFVYCPHCGKQLSKKQGISLRKGYLIASMTWAGLTVFFILMSVLEGSVVFLSDIVKGWAACSTPILYAFGVWAIYTVAKHHGRNAVRWTTAAIVFSPVLAWAVYGLTWRKSQ